MPKYPNGCKVTTKNSESCKANEINLLCNEGISQIYISSELTIHEVVHDSNVFHLYASSSLGYGICPYCGHVSSQVHSRYSRTIYDLSILGERVVIHLEVRKFFCHNEDCRRKTFVEQPGDEVFRYRRRTCRCERVVDRQITEVADKFHLVKNITDRMTKLVAENYADYRQAVRSNEEGQVKTTETTNVPLVTKHPSPKPDSRCVVFNEVKELQQKGFKPTTIAKKLGIARQTATKYYNMDSLPGRNSKLRNEYYKYDAYVEQEATNGKPLSAIHNEESNEKEHVR